MLDILGRCKSHKAQMDGYAVAVGAQILAGYLNDIAKCAERIGDNELLELLEGMMLIDMGDKK